ncbi:MAG: hypothetical protein COB04_11530 [Gammaproteobacteria bacterium]|nr:MAG: hypothetical protein COB04_11530 [Gammaproteobacteria bacterium]
MTKDRIGFKFSRCLAGAVLLLFTSFVYAAYPSGPLPSASELKSFAQGIENDPVWVTENMDQLARLRPNQLDELITDLDFTHFTFLHVMRMKGQELGNELLGEDLAKISMMSVRGGQLKPIPFQVDEFGEEYGWIYVPGKSPGKVDGVYQQLDEGDELIFMYRDTSKDRFNPETMAIPEGKIAKELKLTPKIGPERYTYILLDNPLRSEADYVDIRIEKEGTFVETTFYHTESDPKSFIEFRDFQAHIGSKQYTNILDAIRINAAAGIFFDWARGAVDNDNVRIHIIGAHDGAVRVASLAKLEIYIAGIQLFSLYTQVNFYDQGIHIPNRTEIGAAGSFAKIFRDPTIEVSLDFVDATNAVVSAASVWDDFGVGVVDGKMTEMERRVNELPLPGDWIWMDSKQGWDVFMQITLPPELTDGMHTAMLYLDDPNDLTDWERYPGAKPRIGLRTKGLPTNIGTFHELELDIGIWFPDSVGPAGPKVFFEELSNPPVVEISNPDAESMALL